MAVESIQCVKCGSPLEVESTARFAICGYCGSRLRITRGASGHPLGVLEDIKLDTEIIAKQTAIDHLRDRLSELVRQRQILKAQLTNELHAAGRRHETAWGGCLPLAGLIVILGCLASNASFETNAPWLGAGFLLLGIGIWRTGRAKVRQQEARRKVENTYGARIARIDEQIQSTQRRIVELQVDMDRLAREL